MKRKSFISKTGLLLSALPFSGMAQKVFYEENLKVLAEAKAQDTYKDEDYWKLVRNMFQIPSDYINLENGYFSPQPITTKEFHQGKENDINLRSSWFMRNEQENALEQNRHYLADFLGCETEEVVLTRNTTESLNIVISGYPWKKGDEVIIGNQDYGSMVAAFQQQVKRNGIVIQTAQVPLHPENDEEIINAYISLINNKTKVLHLTHLINLSGQILPVKEIIEAAQKRGVEVMVDAAHSVAHVNFSPGSLNADYVGSSLHKWLCNPLGAGVLMIKKEHISKIWPLYGDNEYAENNVRKFQHQGTRPVQTILSIQEAIRFHESIGGELKEKRFRYLKNHWVEKAKNIPKVFINTPLLDENRSCAIANVGVEGISPHQLASKLMNDHKIFTVAIDHPHIKGVRVTPHLYTSIEEVEALVLALEKISE